MLKKQNILIFICLAAVVGVGLYWTDSSFRSVDKADQAATTTRQAFLLKGERCLHLAIADTPEKRRQGLSGYDELVGNQGMLFLYSRPGEYSFWMKDMDFSIDIFWLTEANEVVSIKRSATPSSYPQSFSPDRPAKKVIETPAGFAETETINSGDRLTVIGPTTTTPVGC